MSNGPLMEVNKMIDFILTKSLITNFITFENSMTNLFIDVQQKHFGHFNLYFTLNL